MSWQNFETLVSKTEIKRSKFKPRTSQVAIRRYLSSLGSSCQAKSSQAESIKPRNCLRPAHRSDIDTKRKYSVLGGTSLIFFEPQPSLSLICSSLDWARAYFEPLLFRSLDSSFLVARVVQAFVFYSVGIWLIDLAFSSSPGQFPLLPGYCSMITYTLASLFVPWSAPYVLDSIC